MRTTYPGGDSDGGGGSGHSILTVSKGCEENVMMYFCVKCIENFLPETDCIYPP